MAQNIDLSFFQKLQKNAFEKVPKLLDELDLALEHVERPVQQTLQMISEMHGAYNGASSELSGFVKGLSSKFPKIDSKIQSTLGTVESGLQEIENITKTLQSLIGRINDAVGHSMDAPTLRAFIGKSQSLHPVINKQIQEGFKVKHYKDYMQFSIGFLRSKKTARLRWPELASVVCT